MREYGGEAVEIGVVSRHCRLCWGWSGNSVRQCCADSESVRMLVDWCRHAEGIRQAPYVEWV